ncbi:peroxynitrite isomerase THAP4-like [Wyeomyia smithii]|uniref:peroxynitrite isomerase THAP4-like n=1 Tax=Wyeomyia smithii TaxID=174621 RepID=UPI002467B98E|nr:peroxynitrite isomerase THAP4-like [Wyeomyia smithii]
MAKVHEALKPIQWLIGTWESTVAKGHFPTIKDFTYHEILKFESLGQPLLNYEARSRHPVSGAPMHLESGFLRVKPGTNQLAFMVSHNFGLAVLEEGLATQNSLEFESKSISRISFANDPSVKSIKRNFKLHEDGTMEVTTDMETSTTELTNHLIVIYKKLEQ